jgi:hypothetical protein
MPMKSDKAGIALCLGLGFLLYSALLVSHIPAAKRGQGIAFRSSNGASASTAPPANRAGQPPAADHSDLPIRFEENQGQTAREVRFVSHGSGYELFLTPQEAVVALHQTRRLDLAPNHRVQYFRAKHEARKAGRTTVLRMRLANANPAPTMAGAQPLPGRLDYFLGNDPAKWRTDIRSYARVKYRDVYPGIDLVFYGNQRRLEYDFIVAPGANPTAIALDLDGARKLRLNSHGDLLASVNGGEVQLQKPLVYQQVRGKRCEINGSYKLGAHHQVTFSVANYDRSAPLVLDPVLIYSTYLGGEADDSASAIALNAAGDTVVAGTTLSTMFPTTAGAFTQSPLASNPNGVVFVTEMDPTGTHQLYSSYVGGSGGDSGFALALDPAGKIYVTGETDSTDFPTTTNALKPGPNPGNTNGTSFVFKIDPTISGSGSLVYSSYLGGTAGVTEFGNGIATDASGAVYIVGITGSQPGAALANFPVTSGAFQLTPDPSNTAGSAFLAKLDTTQIGAAGLLYSTYLGGNGAHSAGPGFGDAAFGVAEDSAGNSYLVGGTTSTNFPTTAQAFQAAAPVAIANGTVFVSRLDTTKAGTASLLYSTYLGGDSEDFGDAIAVGPGNVAYVAGATQSLLFPTTVGAFQRTGNIASISFVSLLDTGMTGAASLKYSTFLGGSQTNMAFAIATNPLGIAYVAGGTQGADFPVTNGSFQAHPVSGSPGEGFVTKLSPAGLGAADLVYSTYFGGAGAGGVADGVNSIAVDQTTNNAYIAGDAVSSAATFPIAPKPGAFQSALNGNSDGFVAELTLLPTVTVVPSSLTFGPQTVGTATAAQMVTLTNNSASAISFGGVSIANGSPVAADVDFTSPADTCGTTIAAAASCTISVVFTPSVNGVESANLLIADGDPSSPQTVTLSGTGTASDLVVSPTSLAFGSQPVGMSSAAKVVTLTNASSAAIAFTSAVVSGGAPAAANADFTTTTTCTGSVAVGTPCTISVVFKPSVAATETADLVITDGDSTSPQTVMLSGTGTGTVGNFTVTASPTTLSVAQGASGTFKITVTPSGGFNAAVALACAGAPAAATCTVAPASVTPTDGLTPVTAMVTVATTSPAVVAPFSTLHPRALFWNTLSLSLGIVLLLCLLRARKLGYTLSFAAGTLMFLLIAGCGGSHSTTGGTPKGTSTLTVTGTSGTLTNSATISLTVN